MENIATRAAYGQALVALAEEYPDLVVLDADLSKSTMTYDFSKAYPNRFYNMGIAEGNMAGVAAGLAACGKKPFFNSFAMFSAGRAWEQVRNSIAYPGLNVKVIGSHGGVSVGEDGATHQCIEDYAIMRAIPNMLVVSPCDGPEMRAAVKALLDYDGPAYMRLGRLAVDSITDSVEDYKFELGKGVTIRRQRRHHRGYRHDGPDGRSGRRAAGRRGHFRPRAGLPHHQAHRRRAAAQGRSGDRRHRHHRGSQRHRRSGLRRV